MSAASESKSRKRRLIIYKAFAVLFLAIAGIAFAINHTFALFSIFLLFIAIIFAALALRLELINHGSIHAKANKWWYFVVIPGAFLCGVLFWFELKSGQGEPKLYPHFTLSLQLGDPPTSTTFLTNDFLFIRRMVKIGNLPHGKIIVNEFAKGCLVIPVQERETNKIFNFVIENDSSFMVTDLEAIVGFPKEWTGGFDPKWHKIINESLTAPGWNLTPTNMQYVAVQSPWILYPTDTLNFPPITSLCTPEYIGSTFKGGLVELTIRCAGFEGSLAANIIFVPVGTNVVKPFVTLGHLETNGTLHMIPTQKELEDSQQ